MMQKLMDAKILIFMGILLAVLLVVPSETYAHSAATCKGSCSGVYGVWDVVTDSSKTEPSVWVQVSGDHIWFHAAKSLTLSELRDGFKKAAEGHAWYYDNGWQMNCSNGTRITFDAPPTVALTSGAPVCSGSGQYDVLAAFDHTTATPSPGPATVPGTRWLDSAATIYFVNSLHFSYRTAPVATGVFLAPNSLHLTGGSMSQLISSIPDTHRVEFSIRAHEHTGSKQVPEFGPISTKIIEPISCTLFDYELSNDGDITVKQGEKGETKITATHIFGSAKDVSFSVSGLPPLSSTPGIPTCKPTCARDLEIFTSPGTPVGTYPITVTGSPLGKTTTFNLIVSSGLVILPSSIDLKVNGKDHQTLADALVKKSGKKVNFDWKGTSVKNCRTWEGDPDWPHPFVPPNGNAHDYTLPTVSTLTTFEYKISCDALAQKGFWSRFLALFRFVKSVFAQAGDANDSVFITVEPKGGVVNSPPSADAGPSHSITSGASHTHSGASASDPDDNLASYLWEFASCPGACPSLSGSSGSISGGSAAVPGPTFTPISLGAYHLKLTVTDTNSEKDDDTVTETVAASPSDPIASLTASPPLILKGGSSDLIWSCDNSTTAEINNGVMAPIACSGGSCSGTKEVSPTVNTNYTLTCTKTPPGATATASVTVQVGKIIED